MNQESYIIGIDLGTTNCTVAYTPLTPEGKQKPLLEQAPILQVVSAQTPKTSFSLPSFIYYPLAEELKAKVAELPWDVEKPFAIGAYARDRGAELPARLI